MIPIKAAHRGRALFAGVAVCGAAALVTACDPGESRPPESVLPSAPGPLFEEVASQVGLDFVHFNGMTGEFYFPEMTGAGAALFDYDNDGDLDAYLVQGTLLGQGKTPLAALSPLTASQSAGDRLFRNALIDHDGRGGLRFEDVTEASGLSAQGYGMAVATGDVDGDGFVDVFVANLEANQLFRNGRDGTFQERSEDLDANTPRWSAGASFCDLDLDGDLDLFVVNYVAFDLERNPVCYASSSRRDYCGPSAFAGLADVLLRNDGDGRFEDQTLQALGAHQAGPGLGVVACDVDADGWVDLFVANDGAANQLWLNQHDGRFRDEGLLAGVALNRQGLAEASMGVDVADFDGDGDEDLFLAHLAGETNTLYVNGGTGLFDDRTTEWGLGAPSLPLTSFGSNWLDADGDGWLDLLTVGGAVRILDARVAKGDLHPLGQRKQLFLNRGGLRFEVALSDEAGEVFEQLDVGRGSAVGDVDNDGDADVLVLNNGGRAQLLLGGANPGDRWLGLRLVEGAEQRDALGARVAFHLSRGQDQWRRVHTDGSFASARDPRVLLAWGAERELTGITVVWPGGLVERFGVPTLGQYVTLSRGTGDAAPLKAVGPAR